MKNLRWILCVPLLLGLCFGSLFASESEKIPAKALSVPEVIKKIQLACSPKLDPPAMRV